MRRPYRRLVLALVWAFVLLAPRAHAADIGGTYLSWWACPGDPRAAPGVPFDCAPDGGVVYTLIGTIGLAEDVPNALSMDADVLIAFPDVPHVPEFWDVQGAGCNASAFSIVKGMPANCGGHVNAFCDGDSNECDLFYSASVTPGGVLKLSITAGRSYPNTVHLVAGQRYFAFSLNIPMIASAGCTGCASPAAIGFSRATIYSMNTKGGIDPVTVSGGFPGAAACATANDGYSECTRVPVRRKTWGSLKSLYR